MKTWILVGLFLVLVVVWLLMVPKAQEPLPVEMRPSPIHGRGMFATRPISAGTIVERAPLIPIHRDSDLTMESTLRKYDIAYKNGQHAVMLGYASIYNHSDDNNVIWDFEPDEDIIYIKAIKDIRPGEEVCVSYGPNYWPNRMNEKK
jgi:SET domain-containing protein